MTTAVLAHDERKSSSAGLLVLADIYNQPHAVTRLYQMLRERSDEQDSHINISHCCLPDWDAHVDYVNGRPYPVWYLVIVGDKVIGNVYLTERNEIGIVLLRAFRGKGYGPAAVAQLMRRHPRPRFLANINPANARSIRMFQKLGFAHIQNTYELSDDIPAE